MHIGFSMYISTCVYKYEYDLLLFHYVACESGVINCSRGSRCKVNQTSHMPYCEASCDLDNGGCAKDEVCSLLQPLTCTNAPCPSRVICTGKTVVRDITT